MKYVFKSLPKDSFYYELLDFLKIISTEFILVMREEIEFDENAGSLLNDLSLNLLKKRYSSEWPGTRLLGGHRAEIFYYKVNDDTVNILKKYSISLFDWLAPRLPEDLTFFRKDGTLILGSIVHERDYWSDFTKDELSILTEKFPSLKEELCE
jgi:hypothetical protein